MCSKVQFQILETTFQNISLQITLILNPADSNMIDLNLCKKKCCAASLKIVGTELNIQILAIEGDTVFD